MKTYLTMGKLILTLSLLLALEPIVAQKTVKIRFDSNKEVSGQKFAIKNISPGLPVNWDEPSWLDQKEFRAQLNYENQ
jgi:hypothetical protein